MWKKNFVPRENDGVIAQSFLKRVTDGKNIKVLPLPADKAYPPMSHPDYLTLDAQLKAGVNLQEVNSVLIEPSERNVVDVVSQFMEDTNTSE